MYLCNFCKDDIEDIIKDGDKLYCCDECFNWDKIDNPPKKMTDEEWNNCDNQLDLCHYCRGERVKKFMSDWPFYYCSRECVFYDQKFNTYEEDDDDEDDDEDNNEDDDEDDEEDDDEEDEDDDDDEDDENELLICECCDIDFTDNKVIGNNGKIYCSNTCLQAEEYYFDRYDRKYEGIIELIKQYSPPSVIDENVTEEDEQKEEEWLYTCRRSRCYNGPAGGPPGLENDKYPDPEKAVRFRRLCEYYSTTYPELKAEKRTETKLIDNDLIYSLANDYLELQEYFIKQIIHNVKTYIKDKEDQKEAIKKAEEYFTEYIKLIIKDKWIDFEYLKQLRIEGVARGLNEEEIRDIIKEKKEDINWLKIM